MTYAENSNQYDQIGEDYITTQRSFFGGTIDWPRQKIRSHLKNIKGLKILDVGCGGGDDVLWCEQNGADVYGIDQSEKMTDLAMSKTINKSRIKLGSYTKIPFPDNYFDFVYGRFSLHYVKNLDSAYIELARVLKPGGALLQAASHPIFDTFAMQQAGENKVVKLKLYNGKVTVEFPPHSMTDYFSDTFLDLFDLKEIDESESVDAENPNKLPETLFFKAIKRA